MNDITSHEQNVAIIADDFRDYKSEILDEFRNIVSKTDGYIGYLTIIIELAQALTTYENLYDKRASAIGQDGFYSVVDWYDIVERIVEHAIEVTIKTKVPCDATDIVNAVMGQVFTGGLQGEQA